MSEQHFRTPEGQHLGGFSGGAIPPAVAIAASMGLEF
mgnify:FL=1